MKKITTQKNKTAYMLRLAHSLMKKVSSSKLPENICIWVDYKGNLNNDTYDIYITFFVEKSGDIDNATLSIYNTDNEYYFLKKISRFDSFIGGDYDLDKIRNPIF